MTQQSLTTWHTVWELPLSIPNYTTAFKERTPFLSMKSIQFNSIPINNESLQVASCDCPGHLPEFVVLDRNGSVSDCKPTVLMEFPQLPPPICLMKIFHQKHFSLDISNVEPVGRQQLNKYSAASKGPMNDCPSVQSLLCSPWI